MRILTVGAHLDDVEIACGGTIARATSRGHRVYMLVLSDSSYTATDGTVLRTREQAFAEGEEAAKLLGVSDIEVLDFPAMDIPYHSDVVRAIEERIAKWEPEAIFTHWPFDTHQSHHHTGLSSIAAARYSSSVMMYEPMMPSGRSYVGFRPQVYVDISDHIEAKLASLRAHESQYVKYGDAWTEAIEARSRLRGFEIGVRHAEAFEALRLTWLD